MSEHELANLFTYKMKQGNYGTNGESGAGIGLMLCKDFIERNNGQIKVNSKEKEGTQFMLYFHA
jgi:K+-sensing histidine kinase KdpD